MRASIILAAILGAAPAHAQPRCQQTDEPAPPLVLRFVTERPPALGPKPTLQAIALSSEYTMRNCVTGTCAYTAVRNADLIRQHLGRDANIFVSTRDPRLWRGPIGLHATAELDGLHLNYGQLDTLADVIGPRGEADLGQSRNAYVTWEAQTFGRDVTRVPWRARVANNVLALPSMSGGFAGGMLAGVAVDRVARSYDVDPVYRVGLVQTGGYLGSVGGSAALGRIVATPKMPVGALGGTLMGAGTTGLGVHATMWHDVIEPEASHAMNQMTSSCSQPLPQQRHVSDGGANLRRELREQRDEADYYACIARFWGLGIYFCSYPQHWK